MKLLIANQHVSLFRLNQGLPGREAHPEVMQGTTEFHHEITDPLLPQADPVFHDATALHTAVHVLHLPDIMPPKREACIWGPAPSLLTG
jgi:hypothetical protein